MIDELPTRAAMTVAAFLLLATGLSVLGLSGGDAVHDAARALADHLSREFDALAGIEGGVTVRGGVGVSGFLELPPTLAGASYRVEFRSSDVRVVAGASVAAAPLRCPVHPFLPLRTGYTSSDLGRLDAAVLRIQPGDGFVLERLLRSVDGRPAVLSFVHLP